MLNCYIKPPSPSHLSDISVSFVCVSYDPISYTILSFVINIPLMLVITYYLSCSELFTNCLDMICTLLNSLSSEFHTTLASGGEEGKKAHTSCIKKLKGELANSKSYCISEIRQLFPLPQKTYSITTVKPPPSIGLTKGIASNDRIKVATICFLAINVCI